MKTDGKVMVLRRHLVVLVVFESDRDLACDTCDQANRFVLGLRALQMLVNLLLGQLERRRKPRGQLLKMGPGWDYDRSQGSADGRDFNPRVWRSPLGADYFNESPWWDRLFQDPDFWQAWIDRYQELRDGPLSMSNIFALIDRFAAEAREAQLREQGIV